MPLHHTPMKECGNCGAPVTDRYARVMSPPGEELPRACPECDLVRGQSGLRDPHT